MLLAVAFCSLLLLSVAPIVMLAVHCLRLLAVAFSVLLPCVSFYCHLFWCCFLFPDVALCCQLLLAISYCYTFVASCCFLLSDFALCRLLLLGAPLGVLLAVDYTVACMQSVAVTFH